MAVPSSGELRLYADIGVELGVPQSNVSLGSMSDSAGFAEPDAMSDFYGYVDAVAPSVTTNSLTSIGETSMTLNGNVTSDGGASITQRGFYFGTNSSSPTNNTKYTVGGTTGSYTLNRTGLSAGTTYYCWAFATNSAGTTYGSRTQANTIAAYNPDWRTASSSNGVVSAYTVNCNFESQPTSNTTRLYYLNPNTGSYVQYAYFNQSDPYGGTTFLAWLADGMTNSAGRSNNQHAFGTVNYLRSDFYASQGLNGQYSNGYGRINSPGTITNFSASNNRGSTSFAGTGSQRTGNWYVQPNYSCPTTMTAVAYFTPA